MDTLTTVGNQRDDAQWEESSPKDDDEYLIELSTASGALDSLVRVVTSVTLTDRHFHRTPRTR